MADRREVIIDLLGDVINETIKLLRESDRQVTHASILGNISALTSKMLDEHSNHED